MDIKSRALSFVKNIFPSNYYELFLFLTFVTLYGVFGFYIADNYRIVFDNRIPWDAYFSFDNRAIIMTGGGVERHPFSKYFFDMLRQCGLYFSDNQYNSVFRVFLTSICTLTISLHLILIYKYLTNIIDLSRLISTLILFFYSFFSTNILLSFTPETYTFTLFLLVLFNYYAANKIQKQKSIPISTLTLFGLTIGGLTITNIVKVFIPLICEIKRNTFWKSSFKVLIKIMTVSCLFIILFCFRIGFDIKNIIAKSEAQYEKFSNPKTEPVWDMITSWFFGGNVIFSSFITRDYHNGKGFEYKALFMETYSSPVLYGIVFILTVVLLWSIIKNFKNQLVQVLVISLFIDITIHCVLKFGLHTSYIYGGHFVFVYPILIGWLFKYYNTSKIKTTFLLTIVSLLTTIILAINIYRLNDFFLFLESFYK